MIIAYSVPLVNGIELYVQLDVWMGSESPIHTNIASFPLMTALSMGGCMIVAGTIIIIIIHKVKSAITQFEIHCIYLPSMSNRTDNDTMSTVFCVVIVYIPSSVTDTLYSVREYLQRNT